MYAVSEIFENTIQGEGYNTGAPCHFLRFSRCNYWTNPTKPSAICPFCDTRQLFDVHEMSHADILRKLTDAGTRNRGVVITGGEPMLQLTLELLEDLADRFDWVDIETNGSVRPPWYNRGIQPFNVRISCSPKTEAFNLGHADQFKILIPDKKVLLPFYEAKASVLGAQVYLQPTEIGGPHSATTLANTQQCVQLALERGHRISVQLHKILGVK